MRLKNSLAVGILEETYWKYRRGGLSTGMLEIGIRSRAITDHEKPLGMALSMVAK